MKLPENTVYYWTGIAIWACVFAMHIWLLYRLYRAYADKKTGGLGIALSFFVYLAGYSAPTSDNYLLYLVVLSAVLWSAGAGYVAAIPNILLVLMFFGKFSTFTSGIAFFVLFGLFSVLFRKKWKSLLLFVPALIGMPVLYLLYCPSFESLAGYVSGILKLSDGWMLTMQWGPGRGRGGAALDDNDHGVLCTAACGGVGYELQILCGHSRLFRIHVFCL